MKRHLLLFALLLLISGVMLGQEMFTVTASVSPAGSGTVNDVATFTQTYTQGETCTLTAVASTGYTFSNWTEEGNPNPVSTSATYSFQVNENRTLVANFTFTPVTFTINASVSPAGSGTVNDVATFTQTYTQGETCTLTAVASTGYTFSNWTEEGNPNPISTNATYSFQVNEDRTLVANFTFTPVTFTINASVSPAGSGTVNDVATFTQTYTQGETCTLTAVASTGYTFSNWTEEGNPNPVSTSATYSFQVNEDRTLVANFEPNTYAVTLHDNGGIINSGNVTSYTYGVGATLPTDVIKDGHDFGGWYDNSNFTGDPVTSIPPTATGDKQFWAKWTPISYTITTSVYPPETGTVTQSGNGTYNHGANCTLTATANTGYHFVNWTEEGNPNPVSTNATYSFTVYGSRTLVANFGPNTYAVTLNPNGGTINSGNVTSYTYGVGATLPTDVTKEGHTFSEWYDNSSFTGSPVTSIPPTATGDKQFWAKWTPISYTITTSVNPPGTGTATGNGTYNYGTDCTLTATANTGYTFINWTKNGTQVSTETTYTFTVIENAQYVANFTAQNYTISASADPSEGGTISGSGGYNYGETCTLTATVNTGYHFLNWTKNGTVVTTETSFSFTVEGSAQYIAHFQINSYNITANANPSYGGSVTGDGTYNHGQTATLTEYPNLHYHFLNWTENGEMVQEGGENYQFIVEGPRTLVANFQPDSYNIIANVTPTGAGTVTGDGPHDYGSTCSLTATPNTGYHFDSWKENGSVVSNNASYSFQVEGPRTLEAHFEINSYTITTEVTPIDTAGTVTGGGTYNYNTPVTLTATPGTGYHFNNWTVNGQVVQTNTSYSFTVTSDSTMVANFEINSYNVTANANPSNAGTVTGGGTYNHGQTATLTATANSHRHFDHWEDGSTQNPRQITVTSDGTYTAYFVYDQHTITVNADPENGGTVTGGGTYNYNTQITLEAIESPGYQFSHWQDDNTQNPRQVAVTGDATYTAHFNQTIYQIQVQADPANGGTVTGGGAFHYGDTPTLYATANSGYTFQGWNDGNTQNPRQITVTGNATYTAFFAQQGTTTYNVTATVSPVGAGTVSGTGVYQPGAQATLTATANTGYTFDHWQDGNTQNPRTVTVNSNLQFTAYFTQNTYTINTNVNPAGSGTVTGGGNNFHYGDQTTLTATAYNGYEFDRWNDGITQNPRQITVTGNTTYTAHFEQVTAPEYTITVNADPTDGGEVTGGGTYQAGTQVTLTATANSGYFFDSWNDGNTQPSHQITVTGNTTYTAHFERQQYTVTTYVVPLGSGDVTGGGTYPEGTEVILTATPRPGYAFDRWNDNVTENPRTITVTGNVTYTAAFTPILYTITVLANPEEGGEVEGGGHYMYGDTCTVKATANPGFTFIDWTDGDGTIAFTESVYSFVVTGDRTLTANFAGEGQHIIYVEIDPPAGGTATGSGAYDDGEECTLKAFAKLGYHFVNWTMNGEVISEFPTYTFTVNETALYVAHFEQNKYTIAVTANPEEGGTVSGGGQYLYGVTCTLAASPNQPYEFLNWTDENNIVVSEDSEYTFTVTTDASYTANFGVEGTYTISVLAEPEEGGTVYVGDTPGTTEMDFTPGQTGKVTALANEGYTFVNWTANDNVVSTEAVYTFTVRTDSLLVAHFTQQYVITVTSNNDEWGTVTGGGTFNDGDFCSLIAKPEEGYVFANWTENGQEIPNQGPTYQFEVHSSRNLVANFKERPCVGDIQRIQPKYHHTGINDSVVLVLIYPNPQYNYDYQWYKDGNIIPGATGQYYYQKGGVDDGVYKVKLSLGDGCSDYTEDYYVDQSRRLCIYPNPSRQGSGIVVEKDCEGQAQLTICSVDGRVLYTEMVTDSQVTLHLHLPIGVYVARLTDSEGYTKIGKLIIK